MPYVQYYHISEPQQLIFLLIIRRKLFNDISDIVLVPILIYISLMPMYVPQQLIICILWYTGVWFIHCHYEFHLTMGMAAVFIVEDGPTMDTSLPPPPVNFPTCGHDIDLMPKGVVPTY